VKRSFLAFLFCFVGFKGQGGFFFLPLVISV